MYHSNRKDQHQRIYDSAIKQENYNTPEKEPAQNSTEVKKEKNDEDEDEKTKAIMKLPPNHSKGLMSTLIGLIGPEAVNRKPDPLPPFQPMQLDDEEEIYLGVKKKSGGQRFNLDTYLDFGISEEMLEEADLDFDDIPTNARDLLPTEIGKDVDKPELFCQLCGVQTTSMGNFRDHLNGKGHRNATEAFRLGKKVASKKKKSSMDLSIIGQKSVTMEMVEGLLEPILGLSYITEYHSITGIMCVCNLCGVKFDRNIVVSHVTGSKHRLHYMKEKKPQIYIHLKKFGGKKSQLTAFLDELSVDAELEDGRGLPTIKIYELPNEESEMINIISSSDDINVDELTQERKRYEAMLARRKPGTISFQDWVNEEFNKARMKKRRSPSPCGRAYGKNSESDMRGNYTRLFHQETLQFNMAYPMFPHSQFPVPPPMPYSMHNSSSVVGNPIEPASSVYMYPGAEKPAVTSYDCRALKRDAISAPEPVRHARRVETHLDPDPTRRIPPKRDTFVIDYGHSSSRDIEQCLRSPKSILKRTSNKETSSKQSSVKKNASDQWENDIQRILGGNARISDGLAAISCTYLSPDRSPSVSQPQRPLPFSKSYMETMKIKEQRKNKKKTLLSPEKCISHTSRIRSRSPEKRISHTSRIRSRSPEKLISQPSRFRSRSRENRITHTLRVRSRSPEKRFSHTSRIRSRSPEKLISQSSRFTSRSPDRISYGGVDMPRKNKSRPFMFRNRSRSPPGNYKERSRSPVIRNDKGHGPLSFYWDSPDSMKREISTSPNKFYSNRNQSPFRSQEKTTESERNRYSPISIKIERSESPADIPSYRYQQRGRNDDRSTRCSIVLKKSKSKSPLKKHYVKSPEIRGSEYPEDYRNLSSSFRSQSSTMKVARKSLDSDDNDYVSSSNHNSRHYIDEKKRYLPGPSRLQMESPEESVLYKREAPLPSFVVNKEYINPESGRQREIRNLLKLMQDTAAEKNEETQLDKFTDLFVNLSNALTEGEDMSDAIIKLLSTPDVMEVLLSAKTGENNSNNATHSSREKIAFSLSGQSKPKTSYSLPSDFGEDSS